MLKKLLKLIALLGLAGSTAYAEPLPIRPLLLGRLPMFDIASVKAASVGSGGGALVAGVSKPSGCTASTLLWVDSGGLVQCGATAIPSATTRIEAGPGALVTPTYSFSGAGNVAGIWNRANSAALVSFSANSLLGMELNAVSPALYLASNWQIFWSDTTDSAGAVATTGLEKLAPGVLAPTLASSTGGWISNLGGEASLAANFTNATTTLNNTNLSRTLISGRTYTFDLFLFISQSTATDGWKIDFNGNALGITNFVANCSSTAETGIIVVLANATSAALATVINATTTVTTGGQVIECHGSIVPSGNGTFIIRAADNTAVSGTLTVKRGSFLAMRDSPAL